MIVFHGSNSSFTDFNLDYAKSGGFHFGTLQQAKSIGKFIYTVELFSNNLYRSIDVDSAILWNEQIKIAINAGYDGIVYLNRFEGFQLYDWHEIQYLYESKLSDIQFKEYMPSAEDSYLIWDINKIKIKKGI